MPTDGSNGLTDGSSSGSLLLYHYNDLGNMSAPKQLTMVRLKVLYN